MNWLALIFAMQIGMTDNKFCVQSEQQRYASWQSPSNALEITIEPTFILFDHIEITSFMKSYQIPDKNTKFNFSPYQMDYGIGARVKFDPFSIGVTYECDHTINLVNFDPDFFGGVANNFFEYYVKFEHKFNF
jgi:hypothetical protein